EMEYRANPANLIETYRNTARDVKRFYDAYTTALHEGKMNTVARLKKLNPEWAKALEQLETRQKFLDQHFELSQEIAAESIGIQLDSGNLVKPGMTAQEVADLLYKQSAGLRQSSRINPSGANYVASKEILVREITVGGDKYKVVMNANGEARLMKGTDIIPTTIEAKAAKAPAKAPAAAPKATPTATPAVSPTASPAAAPAHAPTVVPPAPAEYVQFKSLETGFAEAEVKLKAVTNPGDIVMTLTPEIMKKVSVRQMRYIGDFFNELTANKLNYHLTKDELGKLYELITKSDDLSVIRNRKDYMLKMHEIGTDFAKSIGADVRFADLQSKFAKAQSELKAFQGDAAKMQAVSDYEKILLNPPTAPAIAPAASPAAAPVLKTHDTATLAEPLANIPDEATVAYGTMSPGGHWVEVTKLKTGDYLVVEVQGGKAVSETTMSKLDLFDEGSQHVLRGLKKDGTAYEYANIHETFKPSTYATKPDLVFPAAPVSPTASPAITPTVAPAGAPTATPAAGPAKGPAAAAPAGPKPLATRRAELNAEISTAKAELEIKRNALVDARKRLEPIEKAYTRAQAGTDTVKINTLKSKYESQLGVVQRLEGEVTTMSSEVLKKQLEWTKLSAARGGEVVIDRLGSPLRSKWVKDKLDTLSKIPGIPGKAFGLVRSAYIEIGNYAKAKNLYKIIEYSAMALPGLREIWKATKGQSSAELVIKGLLGEHLKDLQDLNQLQLANIGDMSVEDQMDAIEKSWNNAKKVAGSGGFGGGAGALNSETLYSEPEQEYIKDKRANLKKIIEDLINESPDDINKEQLEKLIGDRLGAELNDTNKVYEITVDGIKIRVDKEGKRNFDGTDKWITDRPKKKSVGLAFKDTDTTFGDLNTRKIAKLNGGKAPADLEEYKKIVTEHLKKQIVEKLGDQDVSKGLTVYSKGRTEAGDPNFTAKFNEKGALTVEIHDEWLNKTYEASKVAPKPVPKPKPKPEPYDYAGEPSPKADADTAAAPLDPANMPIAEAPKEGDDVNI
ncbi:hypothetical protein IT411_00885, partial [Candidatus Peregrinibacteria bacterium]|nr:hypothetical protein [Candidatus Peregrinibacteria bacterium]